MEILQIEVSVEEVRNYLNGLDTSKACGPDGIPARLLKQCSEQIAPSLCAIFNNSLSSGRNSKRMEIGRYNTRPQERIERAS